MWFRHRLQLPSRNVNLQPKTEFHTFNSRYTHTNADTQTPQTHTIMKTKLCAHNLLKSIRLKCFCFFWAEVRGDVITKERGSKTKTRKKKRRHMRIMVETNNVMFALKGWRSLQDTLAYLRPVVRRIDGKHFFGEQTSCVCCNFPSRILRYRYTHIPICGYYNIFTILSRLDIIISIIIVQMPQSNTIASHVWLNIIFFLLFRRCYCCCRCCYMCLVTKTKKGCICTDKKNMILLKKQQICTAEVKKNRINSLTQIGRRIVIWHVWKTRKTRQRFHRSEYKKKNKQNAKPKWIFQGKNLAQWQKSFHIKVYY